MRSSVFRCVGLGLEGLRLVRASASEVRIQK